MGNWAARPSDAAQARREGGFSMRGVRRCRRRSCRRGAVCVVFGLVQRWCSGGCTVIRYTVCEEYFSKVTVGWFMHVGRLPVVWSGWRQHFTWGGSSSVPSTRVNRYLLSLHILYGDGGTLTPRPRTRQYQSQAQQEQASLHYWTSEVAPQTARARDWLGAEAD